MNALESRNIGCPYCGETIEVLEDQRTKDDVQALDDFDRPLRAANSCSNGFILTPTP